jgi:hypothetical protein
VHAEAVVEVVIVHQRAPQLLLHAGTAPMASPWCQALAWGVSFAGAARRAPRRPSRAPCLSLSSLQAPHVGMRAVSRKYREERESTGRYL